MGQIEIIVRRATTVEVLKRNSKRSFITSNKVNRKSNRMRRSKGAKNFLSRCSNARPKSWAAAGSSLRKSELYSGLRKRN